MCRAGGPRCHGRRKAAAAAAQVNTGTAVAQPAPSPEKPKSTVPSRDDTDRLAAAYDPNATGWDGKPLSDKDRRLYALRDSGYEGGIDQDGYPSAFDMRPKPAAAPQVSEGTRRRVDEMAEGYRQTRTAWNEPLDDWGRRQHALRDSGYTGPIDELGYPMEEPTW